MVPPHSNPVMLPCYHPRDPAILKSSNPPILQCCETVTGDEAMMTLTFDWTGEGQGTGHDLPVDALQPASAEGRFGPGVADGDIGSPGALRRGFHVAGGGRLEEAEHAGVVPGARRRPPHAHPQTIVHVQFVDPVGARRIVGQDAPQVRNAQPQSVQVLIGQSAHEPGHVAHEPPRTSRGPPRPRPRRS